ncbi:hypothetical protein F4859DRAFT_511844 [Xylaria cf. heliscus]|nr:hypothetical protein F4859DRAFT_511844 [Xylaria cf. heliscus]
MEELSQTVFAIAVIMIPVTAVAVALRIWDRFGRAQVPGWDDGLIILSWILSMVLCATIAALMKYGLGAHRDDVSLQDYTTFLKFQTLASISYSIGMTSAKASFAVLYLRLFPVRRLVILNKAVITFLLFQATEESLIVIFKCKPIRRSWMPDLEDGYCLDLHPLWYTTFAFNFATDIILFMQPILVTRKLRMPVFKRCTIGAMLSLGFFVTGISIIRLTYVISIGTDDTYQLADALIWSAVEVCSLIICSCIPSFGRVTAKIPHLSTALGLSARHGSATYGAQQGDSIPPQRRTRKEYTRSKSTKSDRIDRSPSTTHTTATASGITDDDSRQKECFPDRADSSGAVMVVREAIHSVKSREDSIPSKTSDIT